MVHSSSGSVRVFYPGHSREELIARLRMAMPALAARLPVRRAVLFGSWAHGRATAFSDIDVVIVYAGPRREDAHDCVRETIGLPGLEPHIYTEVDAAAVWPTLERMLAGGVDLR